MWSWWMLIIAEAPVYHFVLSDQWYVFCQVEFRDTSLHGKAVTYEDLMREFLWEFSNGWPHIIGERSGLNLHFTLEKWSFWRFIFLWVSLFPWFLVILLLSALGWKYCPTMTNAFSRVFFIHWNSDVLEIFVRNFILMKSGAVFGAVFSQQHVLTGKKYRSFWAVSVFRWVF